MLVYVQDKDGKPLMPTSRCGKVRRLLKAGMAVVVEQIPFTIRLCYETTNYVQPITLGVDTGTKHVGLSATTERIELYSSEIELRSNIVELISERAILRKTRRKRKLRYRKRRISNRKKGSGWLPPSTTEKVNSHIRQINFVCKILPVSKIIIELGSFDTQKMRNPGISNKEYQQGEQMGFRNIREYVLARDRHQCQYCHGKSGDRILNVHHIESRKTGGNSLGNLITLCRTCHKKYHKGEIELDFKRSPSSRDASVITSMKYRLYKDISSIHPNVYMTFGCITKCNRIRNCINKSHSSDAFVISNNLNAKRIEYCYVVRITRRHNRSIHSQKPQKGGTRKNNIAPFEVKGFRLFDRVLLDGKIMFVIGRRTRGVFLVGDFYMKNRREVSYRKLKLIRVRRNIIDIVPNQI